MSVKAITTLKAAKIKFRIRRVWRGVESSIVPIWEQYYFLLENQNVLGAVLEIMLSRLCDQPQLVYRDGTPVRAMIHYGTTTDEMKNSFSSVLSRVQLEELVALLADPDMPRIFTPVGDSLIISRGPNDASQ